MRQVVMWRLAHASAGLFVGAFLVPIRLLFSVRGGSGLPGNLFRPPQSKAMQFFCMLSLVYLVGGDDVC